ncbi:MCE family protein [Litoribacter ruber]|uniref:MCE family protein n=1 Tax=Litoribacter ruber TaxID=702568 RepID=A0AAP2G5P1_9BACT|nr:MULTISPECIES: MlaD family protein [Litoribacter]MBS9524768.1 MCE family protein [Litoribacter alkaliphilus]MBT0812649.1 MCE family protein [Litoribacter ruber]
MKSENRKSVIVGIFTLIGIIILVAGIMTLGGQQKKFVKSFRVKAVFDDVAGLQVGNNVWFSGVKIGTVRKINFYGDSQVEIEMNIEEKTREFIRKDSKATISSDGLIGNKIIVIYGGTTQAPTIENDDRLVSVMPLDTDKMMETLQENNRNLVSITNDLKNLTGKISEGEGIIGAVLTDSLLAENFRNMLSNLESTTVNSNQITADLSRFASKMNQEGTLLDNLVKDTTVFKSLQATAKSLESTTEEASAAAANFNAASEKIKETDNALGMLLNDEQFAQYLKGTLENLESGTDRLDENLEALQHSWLLRRYFRRQARQQAAEEAN